MINKNRTSDQMSCQSGETKRVIVVSRFDPYRWTPLLRRMCDAFSTEQLHVLTLGIDDGANDGPEGRKAFPCELIRIPHMPSVLRMVSIAYSHLALAKELVHLLIRDRIDAIVFENVDLALTMWLVRQMTSRRPSLVYLCSELPVRRKQLLYRLFERLLARHLTGIIANNAYRAEFMQHRLGAKTPFAVLPNTPSVGDLPIESHESCRSFFPDIAEDELVLLYQGIVTPERCLIEVCEAIGHVESGVRLLIVGARAEESHYTSELHRYVSSRGLERRIRIVPWMDYHGLLDLTKSADIGVLLYRNVDLNHYYCAPNKLFEYMSAGIPCIASNFPEMKSIVEGEGIGMAVDPECPSEIANAILRLAVDEERRRQMANRAKEVFHSTYSFDVVWARQRDTIMSWIDNNHN